MKEIICYSKKYGNQTAIIDDIDFININKHRWNAKAVKLNDSQYKFYAQTSIKTNDKEYTILMHQLILGKAEKGFVIDHINGNRLDNTRTNLRKVTFKQNAQNKKSKNKYKGVCKKDNKYQCKALGKYIGLFDDEKTAAIAYDKYIIRNLSSDSFLNFKYSDEEITSIKNEVELAHEIKIPDNIYQTFNNKYQVRFRLENFKSRKIFKKIEDAIEYRNKCVEEIKQLETKKLVLHYQKSITFNKDGIAYILVKYKDEEYECLIDEDKWHDLSLISWYISGKYVVGNINGKLERINRFLYQKYFPHIDITDKLIDHIAGKNEIYKRLDNRLSNLRVVTSSENNYNKETSNNSGYRGVRKNGRKYIAYIRYNKQRFIEKGFNTVEEAALAYNELALKYYGDIAKLNVIVNNESN
jgi:hypothetical protein